MEYISSTEFLLPFAPHLLFCIFSFVFFIIRFLRHKKAYQLILAIAIPLTFTLRLTSFMDNKTGKIFYENVGWIEIILLALALVLIIISAVKTFIKNRKLKKQKNEQ